MRKIPIECESAIVEAYRSFAAVKDLAELYGVTPRTIFRVVRRCGEPTRSATVLLRCHRCGADIHRFRRRAMASVNAYCSRGCYYAHLHNPTYRRSMYGSRVARAVVAQAFRPLTRSEVVHHVDCDQTNNDLANLVVFTCQADHIRWHRLGGESSGVVPLWRGASG